MNDQHNPKMTYVRTFMKTTGTWTLADLEHDSKTFLVASKAKFKVMEKLLSDFISVLLRIWAESQG